LVAFYGLRSSFCQGQASGWLRQTLTKTAPTISFNQAESPSYAIKICIFFEQYYRQLGNQICVFFEQYYRQLGNQDLRVF